MCSTCASCRFLERSPNFRARYRSLDDVLTIRKVQGFSCRESYHECNDRPDHLTKVTRSNWSSCYFFTGEGWNGNTATLALGLMVDQWRPMQHAKYCLKPVILMFLEGGW